MRKDVVYTKTIIRRFNRRENSSIYIYIYIYTQYFRAGLRIDERPQRLSFTRDGRGARNERFLSDWTLEVTLQLGRGAENERFLFDWTLVIRCPRVLEAPTAIPIRSESSNFSKTVIFQDASVF